MSPSIEIPDESDIHIAQISAKRNESTKPLLEGHATKIVKFDASGTLPRREACELANDWADLQAFVRRSAVFPNNLNYGCQIQELVAVVEIVDMDPNTTIMERGGKRTHRPSDADQCVVRICALACGPEAKLNEWAEALDKLSGGQDERLLPAREQLRSGREASADAN